MTAVPLRLSKIFQGVFILVVVLELLAPFVARTNGVDGPSQLNLESQFNRLLASGLWFPQWVPNGFHGFGSPAFYFYPPLAFYATGVLQFLFGAGNPSLLFQAVGLLATIASFFTARRLLAALNAPRNQAVLGAALYAFAPFRIAELYSRSSLSSHVGYVFLPLVWCGLIEMFRDQPSKQKGTLLFAISFALLLLTSVPIAALTIVTMLVASAVLWRTIHTRPLLRLTAGTLLAIALVAVYLTSILSYRTYVQLGYLSKLREFFLDDLLHRRNIGGLYHLALIYAGMAAIVFAYARTRRRGEPVSNRESGLFRLSIAITALLILLELPFIGWPLLSSAPLLALVQGTWRFYIDFVLLGVCVVGIARSGTMRNAARLILWIWVLGAILPIALVVFHLHLSPHAESVAADPPEYAPIYTLRNHDALEHTLTQVAGTPFAQASHSDRDSIRTNDPQADHKDFLVNFSMPDSTTFHRFYWPAWHLFRDGTEIPSHPDSIGRAVATLPAGNYTATWKLERAPLETAGLWISGISWASVLIFFGIGLVRRRVRAGANSSP